MRPIILVLIFNLCIIGPVMADEDAFAPARSGKFLCGMPTISKTCAFTSFYEFGANNHLTETNEILISTEPKISAIVEISYQLENGKYCETATGEEFAKARIRYMARDLEDNIANPIRAKLSERIRKYQNKKLYTPSGVGLYAS